jgi:hypothetical protein
MELTIARKGDEVVNNCANRRERTLTRYERRTCTIAHNVKHLARLLEDVGQIAHMRRSGWSTVLELTSGNIEK